MFTEDGIVLVDADSLFFRICCVTKKQNEIRAGIKHSINGLKKDCMSDNMLMAIKGEGNFRQDLYSKYKATRKPLDADLKKALNYAHTLMVEEHGSIMADGMEADDLVAIWAYEARAEGREYTIAGIDKDLLQIPGTHFNYQKRLFQEVGVDEADLKFHLQCLTGDNADNIPGIKGIGPKKADKILAGTHMSRRFDRVCAAWRGHKAGSPFISWRLLRMLRTWEEFEDVRSKIADKTTISKQDVLAQQAQDIRLQELPTGDL